MTDEGAKPWERRDAELAKAYRGFRTYRDLGVDRTLERVAIQCGVTERTVRRWASAHDWPARAQAWDDELNRREDEGRMEHAREAWDMHRQIGRAMITKALRALDALDVNHIPAGAAARLLEVGMRTERGILSITPAQMIGQRSTEEQGEDPWDVIARELTSSDAGPS